MKASQLTEQELLIENRRLIKNLRARLKRVRGVGLDAPMYAQTKFNELMAETPRDLRDLDKEALTTLNRELRYINNLKSSTVKGAKSAIENFEPVRQKISTYSPEMQKDIWDIYDKVYNKIGQVNYKYNIMDTIVDTVGEGVDTEKVTHDLLKLYDIAYQKSGGMQGTDEALKSAFEGALTMYRINSSSIDENDEEYEDYDEE